MRHRKLSQHGSLLEGSRPETYRSPRLIPGLRPQIVPPPSGPFGRKSLEALPASGPFYSQPSSLRFFCLDLHLRPPRLTSQAPPWPQVGAKQAPATPAPTPGPGPRLRRPLAPGLDLGPQPSALSPGASASPHSQEEAHLLASEGRGGAAGPRRGQESEPAREPTGSRRASDLGPRKQRPPLLRAGGRAGTSRWKPRREPRSLSKACRLEMRNQQNLASEGYASPLPSPPPREGFGAPLFARPLLKFSQSTASRPGLLPQSRWNGVLALGVLLCFIYIVALEFHPCFLEGRNLY